MMRAIARLRDQVIGTAPADRLPLEHVQATGGAGAAAQSPTHNT